MAEKEAPTYSTRRIFQSNLALSSITRADIDLCACEDFFLSLSHGSCPLVVVAEESRF